MKKKRIIWGIIWILVGVIVALKVFNVFQFDIFFDGWWTLLIIIPCAVSLFTEKNKTASLIGVLIGVILLLCCRDVFGFDILWKIALPAGIVIIGIKMIIGGVGDRESAKRWKEIEENGKTVKTVEAVFGGSDIDLRGEKIEGIKCTAVFGGVKCDLTNAVFESDCSIALTCVFGGAEIYLPENVNVQIHSNSFLGGVSDDEWKNTATSGVTVHIDATCVLGGVEIKKHKE